MISDRSSKMRISLRRRRATAIGSAALTALLLSSCAVHQHPFTAEENITRAKANAIATFANQDPVKGPIDYGEALARAVKYNLQDRIKLSEAAVADQQVDVALWDLVQPITVNNTNRWRNKDNAASSESILTHTQSLEPSISTEKNTENLDLRMAYNVLDFGVSYLRARQAANAYLMAEERRQRTIQSIGRDVRTAYWNAVAAERVIGKLDLLQQKVAQAIAQSKQANTSGAQRPLDALKYQLTLNQTMDRVVQLRAKFVAAKLDLARLMNLKPGEDYAVTVPGLDTIAPPQMDAKLEDLEFKALQTRPELQEAAYQKRISADETRKTIVRLLPGIEVGGGFSHDSNRFLTNHNWVDASVSVTWNIVNMLSGPSKIRESRAEQKVSEISEQGMTMAVMTEVYISAKEFEVAQQAYQLALDRSKLQGEIYAQVQQQGPTEQGGTLEVIRAQLEAGVADLERDIAYASLQSTYGALLQATGEYPLPKETNGKDLASLAEAFRSAEATIAARPVVVAASEAASHE
ncbi:MAG: TolC family protein [Rhodospirillaceae bacterium]|nr:MAG: TolC family protein [Rhodospirillaceae bacterium]